ncbi:hypothetical protein E2562_005539 [Oryza meyeriana var. granulata]|uniref:Uncharacterized protein n=1 Tax=Oryza meyeriana var. granulata TaxID=110450 RepID=A0A6G1F432_9ORYZ|nr:hypothetical protein E2562_005539 [Oryza meyeriana var. granulata]
MEARTTRRPHARHRSGRAPPPGPSLRPPGPPLRPRHPPPSPPTPWSRENPSRPAADDMDDDAITALMDIDDSPRSSGAGAVFLDEEEDAEVFPGHRATRANEQRGPLPFAGFYNSFDGADFDDTDLA